MASILEEIASDEQLPPPESSSGSVTMRWSPEAVYLTHGEKKEQWTTSKLIAVQLSRSEEALPNSWFRRLFRRRQQTLHHLHVELRCRPTSRSRFDARVSDPSRLEGIPFLESQGAELPLGVLVHLVHAARVLGAQLALVQVERLEQSTHVPSPYNPSRTRQPPPKDFETWLWRFRGSEHKLLVAFVEVWLDRTRSMQRLEKYGIADAMADRLTSPELRHLRNKVLINMQFAKKLPKAVYQELGFRK